MTSRAIRFAAPNRCGVRRRGRSSWLRCNYTPIFSPSCATPSPTCRSRSSRGSRIEAPGDHVRRSASRAALSAARRLIARQLACLAPVADIQSDAARTSMTYQAPVAEIAFTLKHAAGVGRAIEEGLYGDLAEDHVDAVLAEAGNFAGG